MCSIESSFRFLSFKIDKFQFSPPKTPNAQLDSADWELSISLGQPIFFAKDKIYVSGLMLGMRTPEDEKEFLHAEIRGVFQCEGRRFPPDQEKDLVKKSIPAILMPYLRSAVTSFFANAGYGQIILPLLNMHAVAERHAQEIEVRIVGQINPR